MAVPERKGGSSALLATGAVVAMVAVSLVVAAAWLEVERRHQLTVLGDKVDTLTVLLDKLQTQLDEHINNSHHSSSSQETYEEYDYDNEDSASYEYEDEGGEEDDKVKSVTKRTTTSRTDSNTSERPRTRRSVPDRIQPAELGSGLASQEVRTSQYRRKSSQQRQSEETVPRLRHGGRNKKNNRLSEVEFLSKSSREELDPQNNYDILAAHFVGDTSVFNHGRHPHFQGNYIMYHPSGRFEQWSHADWMSDLGTFSLFPIEEGKLKIKKSGIYLVYAQIYYIARNERCGFHIKKNGDEVAKCMVTSAGDSVKQNTCFTALVLSLQTTDQIWASEMEGHRNTSFKASHSYFGLILLRPN